MNNHFFIAAALPENLSLAIQNWHQQFFNKSDFHKWVHPLDYHITLAFLGSPSSSEQLKKTAESVMREAALLQPFSLEIHGAGTFGQNKAPRILWTGVKASQQLNELRQSVYSICEEHGFQLDKRSFNPHITLARKWKGAGEFKLPESAVTELNSSRFSFQVKEAVLLQTFMDETPKYKAAAEFPLEGG
ncbi:RNA 2',3'-cyclic phosphodiesterase [Bacillus lacus]|uniref:RNA 2',3'-cyclic phosphodiesterase n=1 Tax=Metabacillus lacus TaxID=1983721 RepID=A0A7X2IZY4_9BACI|nr:RNA 2',3'-cyclic phosphodiesterase [Metabacillus lacus]MRX72699.1 RNA 2',3'-cyclic phosphodiesterase [Metabacillus lacus]